ncbi:bifunctional adenosylcobinamide kinase/adenosylcobinamide-phosphate guanylyltransferase [uncultured Novosphingobium sp.]|uniref:bifunctional adenosylcobinamide kinase/adenosylcobinamide-phosphate guanylyltransferase n=1 Tax=uncultured Novosphingobium sp. TaxID=292277 RepID=UPI00258332E6|nr:bifunctional adenosylcobinamide kinase/adenosylcobinamide-phosphate guanylyltransferase [uncultured Novosphingobium sp.]
MSHSLFVLGGARSGKSRYAQQRAEELAGRHFYVATAQVWDEEMRARVELHQADRDGRWSTIEAPLLLAETIGLLSAPDSVVLVDCLTLWATNLLLQEEGGQEADILSATGGLCAAIGAFEGALVLVSNEVGYGIVPENALARRFRDEAGRINQAVAAACAEVMLVAAGLPLRLK